MMKPLLLELYCRFRCQYGTDQLLCFRFVHGVA
jgi:hypothetical protein